MLKLLQHRHLSFYLFSITKIFLDLYLAKFVDPSAKLFFPCISTKEKFWGSVWKRLRFRKYFS